MKNIGLIGLGTVGTGLYHLMNRDGQKQFNILTACDVNRLKAIADAQFEFSDNYDNIFAANGLIDIIVELTNDAGSGLDIARKALKKGKLFVTANKKMIAENLHELIEIQRFYWGKLLYEASVCGSIPVIRILEDFYRKVDIKNVRMICNGTSNYILTQIQNNNMAYAEALSLAREAGFAESNPVLDVDGHDAKFKLIILASHAFGVVLTCEQTFNSGIGSIEKADTEFAKTHGLTIKPLASLFLNSGVVSGYVMPSILPGSDRLSNILNEDNSIVIESEDYGTQQYSGKGAGCLPTAATVYSDIQSISRGSSYVYPKIEQGNTFTNDFNVDVYLRASETVMNKLHWHSKTIVKSVNKQVQLIGRISLSDLIKNKDILAGNCFIAEIPEGFFQQIINGKTLTE
ncbi:MAG: homoserine dehydrogenase [Ignavibacteriales bacterium]|nr:homoserine dehydrogenase [Ignavibacteriales bacterium]